MAEIQKPADQAEQKAIQKTPEAAAVSGVVAAQPNQDVFGEAKTAAHANDKTLSEPDMIAINDGETVAEYKARVAQIQANRFGFFDSANEKYDSAEQSGVLIDYRPTQTGEKSYALGIGYEEGRDSRSIYQKLSDFAQAAAARATDLEEQRAYIQGQLDKIIGIGEGLNIAKDSTKAAVAAGWNALIDGTVANFLSKPNAINDPLFHAVGGALTAMTEDPNAVNHTLEQVGALIMEGSEHYTAAGDREKGHLIGETMFAMVNPEGSTEAGQAALKVADRVAEHIDEAVLKTIEQTLKVAEEAAPEVAQQTKQMLYDYIQSKGLTASQLERGGQIPEGFLDNLEKPPEGAPVGKGGDWPVLNERPSPDVVKQISNESCVAAVGEMLSNGMLKQDVLIDQVGTKPEFLAPLLGPEWKGGFVRENREKVLEVLLASKRSWAAEFRDDFYHRVRMGHMVVVDGLDKVGNVMIRDPQDATRYEMTREAFLKYWSDRALFSTK